VIQRRPSPKAQGAAEKGCAKVLVTELIFLDPVRKQIPDLAAAKAKGTRN
jgi:hypothetical protein